MLCGCCDVLDYCRNIKVHLIRESEISNPDFIRDVRNFAYTLSISSYQWRDHLYNLYRDYRGWVIGEGGQEVFLNMRILEFDHHREWFRDFCCTPVCDNITPYVRKEARGRVIILATILRAAYPMEAMLWGVRPANDNEAA